MTGCASLDRAVTDIKSDVNGGMQRTITVYTADGKELATYKGKLILIQTKVDMLSLISTARDICIITVL